MSVNPLENRFLSNVIIEPTAQIGLEAGANLTQVDNTSAAIVTINEEGLTVLPGGTSPTSLFSYQVGSLSTGNILTDIDGSGTVGWAAPGGQSFATVTTTDTTPTTLITYTIPTVVTVATIKGFMQVMSSTSGTCLSADFSVSAFMYYTLSAAPTILSNGYVNSLSADFPLPGITFTTDANGVLNVVVTSSAYEAKWVAYYSIYVTQAAHV